MNLDSARTARLLLTAARRAGTLMSYAEMRALWDPDQPRDELGRWSQSPDAHVTKSLRFDKTLGGPRRFMMHPETGVTLLGTVNHNWDGTHAEDFDQMKSEYPELLKGSYDDYERGWVDADENSLVLFDRSLDAYYGTETNLSEAELFDRRMKVLQRLVSGGVNEFTRFSASPDDSTEPISARFPFLFESKRKRALEFNPDQPRDEQGQWTSGGSSGFPADDVIRAEYMTPEANERADELGENYIQEMKDTVENDRGQTADEYRMMLDAKAYYQGDGHLRMNSWLRSDPSALDDEEYVSEDEEDFRFSGDEDLRHALRLQQLLDEAPDLKQSVITYRGLISNDVYEVGREVQLNGFQSTTFDPAVALQFVDKENPLVMEIRANQGLGFGEHAKVGESEFLIPHGLRYVVRGVGERSIKMHNDTIRKVRVVQLEMKSSVGKP